MDAETFLDGLMRGALGGRGKRSRGARRAMGRGSLVNAGTLLAAAGVAWGAYEAWKGSRGAAGGPAPRPERPGPDTLPPLSRRPGPADVPPIPGSTPAGGLPEHVLRLIRLMISAAGADGHLGPEEREQILVEARKAGAEDLVAREIESPVPLAEIVGDVSDPALKEQLYTMAFSIVRADETVTGGERLYLAGLAQKLGLDAEEARRIETAAAASIDAAADEPATPTE